MQTLDQSLIDLYVRGLIDGKNLLAVCNDRSEIEKTIGEINVNLDGRRKDTPSLAVPAAK